MLLRVTRPLSGSVDGVDLTQFEPGRVYSFSTSLASFLLAIGACEPCEPGVSTVTTTRSTRRQFEARSEVPGWTGPERRRSPRR